MLKARFIQNVFKIIFCYISITNSIPNIYYCTFKHQMLYFIEQVFNLHFCSKSTVFAPPLVDEVAFPELPPNPDASKA